MIKSSYDSGRVDRAVMVMGSESVEVSVRMNEG